MLRREPTDPTEAVLRVHGSEHGGRMVPADVLARALTGVQQTALILAATSLDRVVRERFRPTAQMRERALILCEIPTTGSFAMPMRLAHGQLDLPFGIERIGLMPAIHTLLEAVETRRYGLAADLVPDSTMRVRAYHELQRFLPQPGEPWAIGFSSFKRSETVLNEWAARTVDDWIAQDARPEDAVMTVTGELIKVFFEEKRVSIRYRPTNRAIDCYLREDAVDALLEDRLSTLRTTDAFRVQVTGQFILDRNGHPSKLTNVYRISRVDTTPMVYDRVHHQGRIFKFDPPLKLDVGMDPESGQLYVATDEELGIHAYAQTRDQLAMEIAEQVAFSWDEYVKETPELLAKGALRLREAILRRVREETDA